MWWAVKTRKFLFDGECDEFSFGPCRVAVRFCRDPVEPGDAVTPPFDPGVEVIEIVGLWIDDENGGWRLGLTDEVLEVYGALEDEESRLYQRLEGWAAAQREANV